MELVIGAVLIVAVVAVVLWFCFGGQQDVLETYEVKLRILGVVFFVACVGVAGATAGIIILAEAEDTYAISFSIPFALFLAGPILVSLWVYTRIPAYLRKDYDPQAVLPSSEHWDLVALASDLSYRIGLRVPPNVVLSGRFVTLPFVVGRGRRSSFLVYPSGLRNILAAQANKTQVDPDHCVRFVLLHELAHIRHGDAPFICWAYYFRKVMNRWLLIGLALALTYLATSMWLSAQGNSSTLRLARLATHSWLVLGGSAAFLFIFSCLCSSVQREREVHADARAWLHIPSAGTGVAEVRESVRRLLTSLNHSPRQSAGSSSAGFAEWAGGGPQTSVYMQFVNMLPGKLLELGERVFSRYPESRTRIKFVERAHTGVEASPFLSDSTAFWAGVNIGLVGVLMVFIRMMWTAISLSTFRLTFAIPISVTASCYGAIVLSLPVRERVGHFPATVLAKGVGRAIAMMIFGYLLAAMCCGFRSLEFGLPLFFGVFSMAWAFFILAHASTERRLALELGASTGFKVMALGAILCLAIVGAFVWWQRERWFCVVLGGLLGSLTAPVLGARRPTSSYDSPLDMCLGAVHRSRPPTRTEGKRYARGLFVFSFEWILRRFVLPFLVFSIFFITLDRWTNIMRWGFWGSTAGKVAIVGLFLTTLTAFVLTMVHMQSPVDPSILLPQISACTTVMEQLLRNGEGYAAGQATTPLGALAASSLSPVLNRRLPVLLTGYVYHACLSLSALGCMSPIVKEKATEILLRCESKDGGFGVWEGGLPRLSSTFWALSVLNMCSALNQVEKEKHVSYVTRCLQPSYLYRSEWSKRDMLEETFFALGSMYLLGRIESVDIERCGRALLHEWRLGRRDEQCTYYCTKSLESLGLLGSPLSDEIRDTWLVPHHPAMQSIKVGKNVLRVFYYAGVVQSLHRAGCLRASDFLPELWRDSLIETAQLHLRELAELWRD